MVLDDDTSLPGVTAAQFRSFARKMPAYYASFITMMLAVMYVFAHLAPWWLSCAIPLLASVLGTWRAVWWISHQHAQVDDETASLHLRRATRALVVTALVVISMDIKLFSYGDVHTRYFLLLQLVASAMCGFYCLMHLRTVALAVFGSVIIPTGYLSLSMRVPSTTVVTFTITITAAVMVFAMLSYQRDFLSLVKARTETLKLSEENLRLAHLDALTGLPNRRQFFEILKDLPVRLGAPSSVPAVGIIDLDGFKPVNDTYGHLIGDEVLADVSHRLQELPVQVQHLCRLGGDEFAFLIYVTEGQDLVSLGRLIIDLVSQPITLESRTISVGCSVGFAVAPEGNAWDGPSLFEQADYAVYHAKRTGRSRVVLFSEEHETLIREQGLIEQTLRGANFDTEIYPLFQPILDFKTGTIHSFECLARWNSPILGPVSPAVFIPIAERTGRIGDLTLAMLKQSLAAALSWPENIQLAFNVSPLEIANLETTEEILAAILRSGIRPERVCMELTETALLNNFAETSKHMSMIRATGVSISLDDFGTGHSSLSYVHALPLDKIKVDRCFIQNLESNLASRKIVRSILTLCRDLELTCIIEGVETQAQLEILDQLGAILIQGFYFSKPLPKLQVHPYINDIASKAAPQMPSRESTFRGQGPVSAALALR